MKARPSLGPIRVATAFAILLVMGSSRARAGIVVGASYSNSTYHQSFGEVVDNRSEIDAQNVFDARSASIALASSLPQSAVGVWGQGGLIGPGDQLELKAFATGAADGNYSWTLDQGTYDYATGEFLGQVSEQWYDIIHVAGPQGASPSSVILVANVGGSLVTEGTTPGDASAGVLAWLESFAGVDRRESAGSVMIEVPLDGSGSGAWDMYLSIYASAIAQANGPPSSTEHASATADFSHTMILNSVLMRDANGNLVTPESLGYTLSFDSGMDSPNLRAVPEPSSIVMIATGAVGLLGYGRRRRARARA